MKALRHPSLNALLAGLLGLAVGFSAGYFGALRHQAPGEPAAAEEKVSGGSHTGNAVHVALPGERPPASTPDESLVPHPNDSSSGRPLAGFSSSATLVAHPKAPPGADAAADTAASDSLAGTDGAPGGAGDAPEPAP